MKIRIDRLIWHGCEYGKRQLTKLQRRFLDGCKNPYRCAECGSKDILCRAWLDGNTYEMVRNQVPVSSSTITRINTELRYGSGGYQLVLNRLKELQDQEPAPAPAPVSAK